MVWIRNFRLKLLLQPIMLKIDFYIVLLIVIFYLKLYSIPNQASNTWKYLVHSAILIYMQNDTF